MKEMGYQKDLLNKAKEMVSDAEKFKIEDVSVQVSSYEDGLKRLSIDIDYNDEKERVSTKDGDMWV